jgi:hypothetical protein
MLRQLEPDARFVRLDERKEPLRDWLRVLVVRIVTPIEFRQTLFIIRGHNNVDCLRR